MEIQNLIAKYTENGTASEIRAKFQNWKVGKNVSDSNGKHKAGDVVTFCNGYEVPMTTEILGFSKCGEAYMLWDCWWASIPLADRMNRVAALPEIEKYVVGSHKPIVWVDEDFPTNHLYCVRGIACNFVEKHACVLVYLKTT